MKRKIVIAGGTGFIGKELIQHFSVTDHVIILTRGIKNVQTNSYQSHGTLQDTNSIRYVLWDATTISGWAKELENADILINLCGKSVNCRYSKKNKAEIFSSRTQTTSLLGEAIRNCIVPPKLWINASSATIYRHATDRPQDEYNGDIENDFSVQVCKAWEKSFFDVRTPFTRKVALRMAVTLGSGGVIVPYFNLLKFGLGGRQGSGKQMYSWIHIKDTINIIEWIHEHKTMEGVFNCSSPHAVTNEAFMKTLQKITGHKFGLPAYEWMLKIGAAIIGTETELILKSRWVLPTKLLETGFRFNYDTIDKAFTEIVNHTPRKAYHLF
ncbi:MAG: TIGR01777 family protein [Sphingobacteriales bacterium]|nr:MAG: TIGR01777 family protein [Sphingobacteriales bacterium]